MCAALSNMKHFLAPFIRYKANTDGWRYFKVIGNHAFIQAANAFFLNHGLGGIPRTSIFVLHAGHTSDLHSSSQDV